MKGSMRVMLAAAVVAMLGAPATASAANATGKNVQLSAGLSVAGVVEDTHGAPVSGAQVGLCSSIENCSDGGSAVAAADGTFAVQAVSLGTYYLQVLPPEGANLLAAWDIGSPGGSTDPAEAVAVAVDGNVADREIHLPDGLRITGLVKNAQDEPVAGVSVIANGPTPASAAATGPDGEYAIGGLTPGAYTLQVYGPERSDYPGGIVVDGAVVADEGGQSPSAYELAATDLANRDITLFSGWSISGHLDGATGRPAEVSAIESPVRYLFPVDAGGNYTIRGLYPGSYHLLFSVPEALGDNFPYGVYDGPGQVLADQSAPGEAIDVAADVTGVTSIVPILPSMSGTLRDASGPVPGAMLNACDPDRGCARAVAGADGTWQIRNVPPGSYTIRAGAAHHVVVGYASGRSTPNAAAAVPVTGGVTNVTGINVVLPRGSSISGTVTGPGGVPLEGIAVFASPITGGISEFGPGGADTAANGSFTVSGLANGSYRLGFSPPEGSPYIAGYWSTGGFVTDWSLATTITVADASVPSVSRPAASIRLGGQLGTSTVPVRLIWTASDPGSNIKSNRLQQQTNGGAWTTVSSPVVPSVARSLKASSTTTYRFRSRGTDYSGNTSADRAGPTFRVLRSQQTSGAITWKGSWTTRSSTSASGGSYRRSSAAGASAAFTFTGRSVGWVAAMGPSYGRAKVYLDGVYAGVVDLHATSTTSRRVVFARTWSSSASHTIRVVGLATLGRPTITVDAFVVLR